MILNGIRITVYVMAALEKERLATAPPFWQQGLLLNGFWYILRS